ncbi:probable sulfoacetate transporter SauU [Anneissia japonica]|uniref:probable sulfoacetate transporter SauU n=1 Tax=Anneissia japonica TaxID=1529436 RepID=UPI00142551C2|nr:probable sulfoacetate transporter SauU [Anneissia japonica]
MSFRDSVSAAVVRNLSLCVALSSFSCCFILWGFGYTYTLLFVPIQDEFDSTTTATGWVGSAYYGIGSTMAIMIGPLAKRFKYSTIFLAGFLLAGISLMVSSFVQSIHAFFVTYGVFYALGTCIGYYITMDLLKMHYANLFNFLFIGFLVQSPIVGKLLILVGWRGVLRIYAAITIIVGLTCRFIMQKPASFHDDTEEKNNSSLEIKDKFLKHEDRLEKKDTEQGRQNINFWKIMAFPESWYFVIGMIITSTATMFSYINIVDFMKHIGISTYVSSWILAVAAGSELAGKFFFGMTGDRMRFPKMYTLAPANVLFAGMMVILIYARTSLHMILIIICIGVLKSIFHAMPWTATLELLGIGHNTEATILTCLGFGIGSLAGALVGGLSYDYTGSYDIGLLVSCGMYIVGAIFFQAAPLHQKMFAPERYLIDRRVATISEKHYEYIVDSYITTV